MIYSVITQHKIYNINSHTKILMIVYVVLFCRNKPLYFISDGMFCITFLSCSTSYELYSKLCFSCADSLWLALLGLHSQIRPGALRGFRNPGVLQGRQLAGHWRDGIHGQSADGNTAAILSATQKHLFAGP
jgi:hypothetical protein